MYDTKKFPCNRYFPNLVAYILFKAQSGDYKNLKSDAHKKEKNGVENSDLDLMHIHTFYD